MEGKVIINGVEFPTINIDVTETPLSEIRVKKLFKDGYTLGILTKKYHVGEYKFPLGNLTVDSSSPVDVFETELFATVLYPYEEYRALEDVEGAKILHRNGLKVIEVKANVKYDDILTIQAYRTSNK